MRKRERKSKEKRKKDESEERKKRNIKNIRKLKPEWITGSNVRNGRKPEETRKFRRQKQTSREGERH